MPEGFRGVARSASWLASEQFFNMAVGVVVGLTVAAILGPEELGVLAYATASAGLVLPALTALHPVMVRHLSTPGVGRAFIRAAMAVSAAVGISGFAVVVALAAARVPSDSSAAAAALVAGVPLLAGALMVGAPALIAVGKAATLARVRMASTTLFALLRLAAALTFGTALVQQSVMSVGVMLTAAATYLLARRYLGSAQTSEVPAKSEARNLLAEGWPFIVSSLAVALYMTSDQVLLGLLATDAETGQYSVAVRFLSVSFAIPMAMVTASAPSIARAKAGDEAQYRDRLQRLASYSVAAAVTVGLASLLGATVIVNFLLGPGYSESLILLAILLPSSVFVSLGVARSQWVVNDQHPKFALAATGAGAILNIGLNLFLIPLWGASGAALSTVCSYLFADVLINLLWGPARRYAPIQWVALNPLRTASMVKVDREVLWGARPDQPSDEEPSHD